jgi:16S rRNA (cytosine1402-N4)-methyltransferase
MGYHESVLLNEAIELLQLHNGKIFIDATLGGGGHFTNILGHLQDGVVIGFDVDESAIAMVTKRLTEEGFSAEERERFGVYTKGKVKAVVVRENFSEMGQIVPKISEFLCRDCEVSGILFDFGVSSYQIDETNKGFSYMKDSPLDMRMDQRLGVQAKDLVNGLYVDELERIIRTYGDETHARSIARHIVQERKKGQILTSGQLNGVIKRSVPFHYENPYAKTYQALRITVNDEIENLKKALSAADTLLSPKGRIVCISFHSLEDREVKQYFVKHTKYKEIEHLMRAEAKEVYENKRSRSAKLRCFEKLS